MILITLYRNDETFRYFSSSPLFTDQKYLYVISVIHQLVETKEKSEDINDSLNKYYQVECYDPESLEVVNSIKLDLSPPRESITNEKETEDATKSITEEIKRVPQLSFQCSTDGNVLTMSFNLKMYFFNLKTGKRINTVIDIPAMTCYSDTNGKFWCYVEEYGTPFIKSFDINGYTKNIDKTKSELLNLGSENDNTALKILSIIENNTE